MRSDGREAPSNYMLILQLVCIVSMLTVFIAYETSPTIIKIIFKLVLRSYEKVLLLFDTWNLMLVHL